MIEGTNSSNVNIIFSEEDIIDAGTFLTGASTTSDVMDNMIERKNNILRGGVNCIPLPFPRFRSEIPGTEQGQYIIITAPQKTCKTQAANFLYMFSVLDYAFEHKDKCSVHIIYIPLEEAIQKIIVRYMSYLLNKLDGIRIAPADLLSTSADYPVSDEIIKKLQSKKYRERLEFFEKSVQFETEDTNPTGILRVCEDYAKKVGVYKSHTIQSKGNTFKEVEVFDSYTDNDPNHYKIVIIDHIGLVDREQGFRTKDAVDKMSEYFVKYLRNRYNYTCVVIQQQASESEGLEAMKQKRMVPSIATLGDSKYTGRDCDLAIGLFDPSKFGLPSWLGYKIQDKDGVGLKSYARFMYVLANRNGEMGGICPLFFDGATCTFEELPKPEDTDLVEKYYDRVKNLKSYRQQKKLKTLISLLFTKISKHE